MPTKRIKSEGAVRKTARTETKTNAPIRAAGTNGTGKPKNAPPRKQKPSIAITQEEIALRAYFLAETRRMSGLPGDELSDWVEAERRILVEKQAK